MPHSFLGFVKNTFGDFFGKLDETFTWTIKALLLTNCVLLSKGPEKPLTKSKEVSRFQNK